MTNILGNMSMPPSVLGGGIGGPVGGAAFPGWRQAQNMAAGGKPAADGMSPERMAALMAALMSPERMAAMRTDVVKPGGPVNSPPLFHPSFNGSGGNGGGGGGQGAPAYGSDAWALQTGGPGAMVWREMARAMASGAKNGTPLGFLDPKEKAFSPELLQFLGPQFQTGKGK